VQLVLIFIASLFSLKLWPYFSSCKFADVSNVRVSKDMQMVSKLQMERCVSHITWDIFRMPHFGGGVSSSYFGGSNFILVLAERQPGPVLVLSVPQITSCLSVHEVNQDYFFLIHLTFFLFHHK
jgi:hypothetical protein